MEEHYPFTLPALPYDYDALAPELDGKTLCFHHDKHFSTYVDGLNRALERFPAYHSWSLERLCQDWAALPDEIRQSVRNNAGGVYNHDLYFRTLRPTPATGPDTMLLGAIAREFGGFLELKAAMKAAALGQFGSGWAWLAAEPGGSLCVCKTANQDTPLPRLPLLCCDVWEHAYYLQYQNRRAEYFENWWRLIDWPQLSRRYSHLFSPIPRRPLP